MLREKYVNKLVGMMKDRGFDIIAIAPSSDLQYLLGFSPHSDERFQGLFLFQDGRFFYVTPELNYEEARREFGPEADIYKWSDTDNFMGTIVEANKKFNIDGKTIAVNSTIKGVDMVEILKLVNVKFENGKEILEELRVVKNQDEVENLRKAAAIADEVMDELTRFIKPGMKEEDIKKRIEDLYKEKGTDGVSFTPIIASGSNSSMPHYNSFGRTIEEKDVIIIDMGCIVNGYCSDISRTFFVGGISDEEKKVYDIIYEANQAGENAAAAGVKAGDVDEASRKVIRDAGYGEYFLNRTGHGIGISVHEAPYIKGKSEYILEDGMAFSIEPGIYIPGKFGMRIEDIVVIQNGKAEILNKFTKDVVIIK